MGSSFFLIITFSLLICHIIVNINWKHGVNALSMEERVSDPQKNKGRISIILWGLCEETIEEADSPPMLTDNTRGNGHNIHATRDRNHGRDRDRDGRNHGQSSSDVCRDFQRGHCRFGDSCKFSHSQ